jgi:hypothetical protein
VTIPNLRRNVCYILSYFIQKYWVLKLIRIYKYFLIIAIFWDIAPCNPYVNRRRSSHLLQPGSLLGLFSTVKMDVVRSSEKSVHIRTTRRYSREGGNVITTAVRTSTHAKAFPGFSNRRRQMSGLFFRLGCG